MGTDYSGAGGGGSGQTPQSTNLYYGSYITLVNDHNNDKFIDEVKVTRWSCDDDRIHNERAVGQMY